MGLIGTLIGLVQMLGNLKTLNNWPEYGGSTTYNFYGALLANMVFSPLAAKLREVPRLKKC